MAATGLLGINPYQKGVNLDFSSRPVALDIQLQQREAAKREALDKYFMDYEKSLDPAVMRSRDQDVFMEKLNANKSSFLAASFCSSWIAKLIGLDEISKAIPFWYGLIPNNPVAAIFYFININMIYTILEL